MGHDQEDKAVDFLVRYHGNGDRNARLVELEIEEIRENIRQDQIDKRVPWYDYRPMFRTSNATWRSLQVIMMAVFGQFSGNGLGYYNAAIFKMLGAKTAHQQLKYNIGNQIVSAAGALTAMSLTDRMKRRKVLVPGTLLVAMCLAINGGLMSGVANDKAAHDGDITNLSLAKGGLAFWFLYNVVYSFTYTPLQGVIPAEALDTTLRAKGLAMYGLVVNLFSFINLYATPIGLANIKSNFVYVFVGWDVVEATLWYFLGYVSSPFGFIVIIYSRAR